MLGKGKWRHRSVPHNAATPAKNHRQLLGVVRCHPH